MKSFFLKRYLKLKPDFDIDNCEVKPALRINTLKIKHKELLKRLIGEGITLKKIDTLNDGYHYSANFSLGSTPEYLQGLYYLQEAASQASAEYLDPKPGETVLDMCASPGSKTTHIAQLMKNEGVIIALDNKEWRLQSLRNNIERMGVTNAITFNKDARYASDLSQEFDKVLLDAPCSGNFLIEENWFDKRTPEDVKNNAKVQRELLRSGYSVLKKNGILVYSTCSMETEENEDIVDWGKNELGYKVLKVKRFWPDVEKTQGFFIAVIKK